MRKERKSHESHPLELDLETFPSSPPDFEGAVRDINLIQVNSIFELRHGTSELYWLLKITKSPYQDEKGRWFTEALDLASEIAEPIPRSLADLGVVAYLAPSSDRERWNPTN